jgi:hypothetical protein
MSPNLSLISTLVYLLALREFVILPLTDLFRTWNKFLSGLPDFSWCNIPKRGKIYQITIKYTKLPQNICILTSSIAIPSKIYPNWWGGVGLKKIPSGNPGSHAPSRAWLIFNNSDSFETAWLPLAATVTRAFQ